MILYNIVCLEEGVANSPTTRTAYDVRVKVKEQIPADLNSPHEVVIKADVRKVKCRNVLSPHVIDDCLYHYRAQKSF
jgi:hypothetical protein